MNFTNSELTSRAHLISGNFSKPIVTQNVLARIFELRCRNFPDFHLFLYFLAVFEILGQPCCCFWSFESSFFIVLAIMIRRLLYVPDYEVSSLNSS